MTGAGYAVRVATYNVHGWRSLGGRRDIARFVETIRELDADVVGLQEVVMPPLIEEQCLETAVAAPLRMHAVAGPTLTRLGAEYGNALLTRFPVERWQGHDLSVRGCEPRGAVEAVLAVGEGRLRVIATHLGLRARERRVQTEALLRLVREGGDVPTVLMGDFNEWMPANRTVRAVSDALGATPAPATFPSCFPVLALDRLWATPNLSLVNLRRHRPAYATCSDHLPLVAEVRHPAGPTLAGR